MTNVYRLMMRRIAPLAAAGMLLQAGSCTLDTAALTTNLVNAITSNLVGSLVSGILGVGF